MKNSESMKVLNRLLVPGKVLVETEMVLHLADLAGTTPEVIERVLSGSEPSPTFNFGAPLIRG